jgi:hypothetical protein
MSDGGAVGTDCRTDPNNDSDPDEYPDLWLDQFVSYLGFGRIAAIIDEDLPPSYLYAVTTIVGWLATGVGYNVYNGTPTIYETIPYLILQPIALLVAVYVSHPLRRSYADVRRDADSGARGETELLIDIVPKWLPWSLFAVAAGLQLVRAALDFAAFSTTGIVATIGFAVFMLHRFMHREKREEIQRLEDELRPYMLNP